MKAIKIKYYAPTNNKGTRLGVSTMDNKTVFYPFDYEARSFEEAAKAVAIKYALAMAWKFDDIIMGTLDNDTCVGLMI